MSFPFPFAGFEPFSPPADPGKHFDFVSPALPGQVVSSVEHSPAKKRLMSIDSASSWSINSSPMKEEYSQQPCAVCGARADGLHYGAISCRSCNAFFRRTVVEKATYHCKHSQQCVIDAEGRCSCRFCRYNKCLEAGMKVAAVQPRRDPTGSQKDRRKRSMMSESQSPTAVMSPINTPITSPARPATNGTLFDAIQEGLGLGFPRPPNIGPILNSSLCFDTTRMIKKEEYDEDLAPGTSKDYSERAYNVSTPIEPEEFQDFLCLVYSYRDHVRMMQLSFTSIEGFLNEMESGEKLRPMVPNDVEKLSMVELNGLLFWIEKMHPFSELPAEDKTNLLKRYSVRKLSLDHFYNAARHVDHARVGNFVMNNYTYVPPHKTGFELPDDDAHQMDAKKETFAHTFERFWKNVIDPFVKMRINDAEIVYLQHMLLWSQNNNEHVTEPTRRVMQDRREWVMRRLFEWYSSKGINDHGVRFGQITLLLGEIETICDMHCQDFQVAKLFEFCDMSQFWYEDLCYTPVNTNRTQYDPHIYENLKRFTAMSFLERTNADVRYVFSPAPTRDLIRPSMEMTVAGAGNPMMSKNVMQPPPISGLPTPSPEDAVDGADVQSPSDGYHHMNTAFRPYSHHQ